MESRLTPFGKMVRELRTKKDVLLKYMAEEIGVTSSFASAVETGDRNATTAYAEKVANYFGLSAPDRRKLLDAAADSKGRMSISLQGVSKSQRTVAMAFARKFPSLSETDVEKLLKALGKEEK